VTGSTNAKTGILWIYDIFGLPFNQTLQGADILAAADHLVVIPDLFKGAPMQIENFPPDNDVKKKALGDFFAGPANPAKTADIVRDLVSKLKEQYPSVEKWAIVGFCWGGKIASLVSTEGSPFVASAQIHPAMVDPADAEKLAIPHFCLATKDEDAEAIEKINKAVGTSGVQAVKEKSKVQRWEGTFHGFMAARANLQDPENLDYYKKG
jgi:dienelactone hydrolase